jgi:hypothetical protein
MQPCIKILHVYKYNEDLQFEKSQKISFITASESTTVTNFQHNRHSSKRLIESATDPLKIRVLHPKVIRKLSDTVLLVRPNFEESLFKVFIYVGISFIDQLPAISS